MSIRVILLGLVVALAGCSPPVTGWRSFQGGLSGQGFQNVKSGFAMSPTWVSEPFKVAGSSPVIGTDARGVEVVYVGAADGRLLALDVEAGRVLWQHAFGVAGEDVRIVSAPAAADDGVLVITSSALEPAKLRSTLHKVDRQGQLRWSVPFPDGGFSTGAPKAMRIGVRALVVFMSTVAAEGRLRTELCVLHDTGDRGELLDRGSLGDCPVRGDPGSVLSETLRVWSRLSSPPATPGEEALDFWFDPTPAVVTGRPKPIIAVVDNHCRFGAFEWDGHRLAALWQASHTGAKHSSPAVLPNRLMVFGDRGGRITAYDVETGVKLWDVATGEPVLATPAASGPFVFVVSGHTLLAIDADSGGPVIQSGVPQRLTLPGATISSPVVTAQRVYIAAGEMITVSHDFKVRSHNTGFTGNGLSSPAVGGDGSLYAVARDGSVWKYQGAQ